MNILIGSRALNYWVDNPLLVNRDTDWDVISQEPIEKCEFHSRSILNNSKLDKYCTKDTIGLPNGEITFVMSLHGLALIKRSHLHRDLSWNKHITHYHRHLAKYLPTDAPELQERIELTHKEYPQWKPNLNQTVPEFFNDAVEKKYNHDYLHELVAYEDVPMYRKMQRNPELAWCYKDLWMNFTHEQKIKCVTEETYVICIERFLVPVDFNFNPRIAYNKSLQKVCTTLCSGWFRDFAIDNYPEVLGMFNRNKIKEVQTVLENS
jgi:hypothetical protein